MTEDFIKKTKICNEYYIDSDSYQLLLQRKSVVQKGEKKGEETYSTVSYHTRIEEVINKYLDIKIREKVKESKNIQELVEQVKKLREQVNSVFKLN